MYMERVPLWKEHPTHLEFAMNECALHVGPIPLCLILEVPRLPSSCEGSGVSRHKRRVIWVVLVGGPCFLQDMR